MVDELDIKILQKFDENIRMGSKQIAKELGVRRQVVDYRIKRMEKTGMIINYRMLGNMNKLGFPYYHRICIKLHSIPAKEKKQIYAYLIKHKLILWVIETDGKYDLSYVLVAKDPYEFQDMLFEFVNTYSKQIKYYDFVRVLELMVPTRDFVGTKHIRKIKGAVVEKAEPIKITELDKNIINELAHNGRQTALTIAKKIGVSAEVTNYHIKQIMKKGLLFSNIQFGYPILDFELYKTLLYVKNPIRSRIEDFKGFARSYPRVWDLIETQGKWQLELDIEAKSHVDYYKIMEVIHEKFFDIISAHDTLYIYKERKFLFSMFS
ncbi:winged helix-turn-helix transcriptional regulator [Nanoarchaeota archaeon]